MTAKADHTPVRSDYFHRSIPFIELLGINRESAESGHSRLSLDFSPELRNMYDAFHGGVIMTLLDVAMASAAVSSRDFAFNVVTVNMSTNFLKPASGLLVAEGKVMSSGFSLCGCEARILDDRGNLVATAIGTFKFRKPTQDRRSEVTRVAA